MKTLTAKRAVAIAMLLAFAGFSWPAAAQTPPGDVPGWQNTRWGMTETEVRKALEAQGFRLTLQTPSESRHSGAFAPFRTHMQVATCDYKVVFAFSDATRRLTYIVVAPSSTDKAGLILWSVAHKCHASLLHLLTEKYGPPASLPTKDDGERTWVFKSTRIKLYEVPDRQVMNDALLQLLYEPTATLPKKDDKEKL